MHFVCPHKVGFVGVKARKESQVNTEKVMSMDFFIARSLLLKSPIT